MKAWLQNIRTSGAKLKNDPSHPKTTSFQKLFILSFLWSRGDRSKKPSRRPLLNPIFSSNPNQMLH